MPDGREPEPEQPTLRVVWCAVRSPAGVLVLICGVVLSLTLAWLVAQRDAQRRDARVEGELRYATAALPRSLQSTQALLFVLGERPSQLGLAELRRLEPSMRALAQFDSRSPASPRLTRVVPSGLTSSLEQLTPAARQAVALVLRRALRGTDLALSRPLDTSLGRVIVAVVAVRDGADAGVRRIDAAVLGLDAFVAEALDGIDTDVAIRIRALRDDGGVERVATYSASGPVRAAIFDESPRREVRVGDRTWVVHAVSVTSPPLLSIPLLLAGLAVTALALTLLTTTRLAERRARSLAAAMTTGLRERTRQIETLTENAPDLIARFDGDRRLVFANSAMQRVAGMAVGDTPQAAVDTGRTPASIAAAFDRQVELTFATGERRQRDLTLPVDGALREFEVRFVPEPDDAGAPAHVLAIARDVTDRVRAEREMETRALRDPLTGLANRALVYDRLHHVLARRSHQVVAVILVDLDRFKLINDSFGHAAGDRVLNEVGSRLMPLLRDEDTLGRLGGDEFVVVAEVATRHDGCLLAERIVEALRPALSVGDRQLSLVGSVGLATAQSGEHEEAHELLRAADAAMYEAKSRGGDGFAIYDQSMRTHAHERLVLENEIRAGLHDGEFVPHFQPLVRAADRGVVGFEALARWRRPDGVLAPPGVFIDTAEQSGLITDLGTSIMRSVIRQAAEWDVRAKGLRLWVNLSVRQLTRPDFLESMLTLIEDEDAACDTLGFEVTETAIAHGPRHVGDALTELRRRGARIAIDDFGIGYSSLSRIKELPIDDIKIDRSFVAGAGHDPNDTALVEAVVRLARARGARTVAEGIETDEQAERLTALGCDMLQGFLFGRPQPPDMIPAPGAAAEARAS